MAAPEPTRAQLERLRAMVESSGDAVYSADLKGRITSWNRGAETLYGYGPREIVGAALERLWPPDARDKARRVLRDARRGRTYRNHRDRRLHRSGRALSVSAGIFPLRDASGKVAGVTVVSRDVSAEAAREQLERRLRALTESAPDAVVALDPEGGVVAWDRAAASLFGYSEAEMRGRSLRRVLPELGARALARLLESAARTGGARALETLGRPRRGPVLEVELVVYTWRDAEGGPSFGAVLRDVSYRKRVDEAERLRERERLQREFVANVSHELRTPVAAIRGFAETLLGGALDDPRERRRFVAIIEKHAMRLGRLIEDLLHLSVLESGRRQPRKKVETLEPLIRRLVGELNPLLRRKQLALRLSLDRALRAPLDPDQVEQVLQNLVSNAIRFSPRRGRITITLQRLGSHAAVTVADQGRGIPADDLPTIFQRFNRSQKRKPGEGGTGLGLSIAKEIVEAHGGRIWAESTEGRGASFHFTIPLRG